MDQDIRIDSQEQSVAIALGKSRSAKKRRKHKMLLEMRKSERREKRIQQKQRKKEKSPGDESEPRMTEREKRASIRLECERGLKEGQRVCVDLSMEHTMKDKELCKLAQQLCRLYGSNRRLPNPAHLYLTGLTKDGRLHQKCVAKNQGFDSYIMTITESSYLDLFTTNEIVYLTPDATNVLTSIDQHKVYVIGGLVDECLLKNLTYSKATNEQLTMARLPIPEYMTKTSTYASQVLSINQVFDIMMNYKETHDWTQALNCGVPQRKGYVISDSSDNTQSSSHKEAHDRSQTNCAVHQRKGYVISDSSDKTQSSTHIESKLTTYSEKQPLETKECGTDVLEH